MNNNQGRRRTRRVRQQRKQKNTQISRILLTVCMIALVAVVSIGGTIAWLTAQTDEITNKFTGSDITISLAESEDLDLKMVPGKEITKDPKVTVAAGSEACWLFVQITETNDVDRYLSYNVKTTADQEKNNAWTAVSGAENVYYINVDAETAKTGVTYEILDGNKVTVNGATVTKDMMKNLTEETYPKLSFQCYAIQSAHLVNASNQPLDEDDIADIWELANPNP